MLRPINLIFSFYLFAFCACGSPQENESATELETETDFKTEVISESESKKNVERLTAALEKAQSNPIDNKIIYGYQVGMSEEEFEIYTAEIVAKKELKTSGQPEYKGQFIFEFGDGSTTNVDIHCSASGVFENFPRIVIRTVENCADFDSVVTLRNKFVDWAIKQYGSEHFVTINHTDPQGKRDLNEATNNYTWIYGSYQLDIVIGNCAVVLTYSGV